MWLNIDPTDEDSWTFGTTTNGTASTNYQVFDENGQQAGDANANGAIDLSDNLSDLMCEDNCVLLVDPNVQSATNNVLPFKTMMTLTSKNQPTDSDNTATSNFQTTTNGNLDAAIPVTITEQGPNSGVFGTYDESDTSVLKITSNAARGTSASIDYNETPVTVLAGFGFATIDIHQPMMHGIPVRIFQ